MAEQNTPPDQNAEGYVLDKLSDAELSQFELTGALPGDDSPAATADEQADPSAEAAAAEPAEQAASRDAQSKADPASAKPEKSQQKQPGQKKSAKDRAAEINAEAEAAERELEAALERRARAKRGLKDVDREDRSPKAEQGAEAAAATEPSWKKYRSMPGAPKASDFPDGPDGLDDYVAAMGAFVAQQVAKEQFGGMFEERTAQDRQQSEKDRSFVESVQEAESRVSKELEADPQILDRIDPRWKALNPSDRLAPGESRTMAHWIKDVVTFKSEHTLKLSERLTANGNAELRRLMQIGDPERIIREIAIMDASFGAGAPADADDDPSQDTVPVRAHTRVSKAPAPAKTLGKKPAAGRDPRTAPDTYDDFDSWNLEETKATAGARG